MCWFVLEKPKVRLNSHQLVGRVVVWTSCYNTHLSGRFAARPTGNAHEILYASHPWRS